AAEARRHERALAGGLLPSRRAADPGFASAAMSLAGATYGFVRGGYRLSGVPKWAAFGREWVMGVTDRNIGKAGGTGAPGAPAVPAAPAGRSQDYLDRLYKIIPAEMTAAYLAIST